MLKKEWTEKGFIDEPVSEETDLKTEIRRMCKKKNAVIMAHYYCNGEIQDVADFIGDSLALARKAAIEEREREEQAEKAKATPFGALRMKEDNKNNKTAEKETESSDENR